MAIQLSVGLRNDGLIHVVSCSWANDGQMYPRTPENEARLEQYLSGYLKGNYERRSSENPLYDEVINFYGYFSLSFYQVDEYLSFKTAAEAANEAEARRAFPVDPHATEGVHNFRMVAEFVYHKLMANPWLAQAPSNRESVARRRGEWYDVQASRALLACTTPEAQETARKIAIETYSRIYTRGEEARREWMRLHEETRASWFTYPINEGV